jgi:hypothetical protein
MRFQNKEDLLVSTYIEIKQKMSEAILEDFNESLPIRDIIKGFWFGTFNFIKKNPEEFQYTEQFANSPFSSLVNKGEVEKHFEPQYNIIQKGIRQKIIKDVPFEILAVFIFYPILILSNPLLSANFKCDKKGIETAFDMAWDAIKL